MVLILLLVLCGVAGLATSLPHWLMAAWCYGAGLALTLVLAAYLTPARWWRRPTVRGVAITAGGTWACGSALALAAGLAPAGLSAPALARASAQAPAIAASATAGTASAASTAAPFRVHRSLNLRAGPDVGSARLAVVPAGAQLIPTGVRSGDWWQVRTGMNGQESRHAVTGWVSSLWLRRLAEQENPR